MSSPITNLKKTSLASKKIIKNHLEFRTSGCMPIEAEVYYVRKNSPPELMDNENLIPKMANRLANLENEMAEVKQELYKALEIINRKDAEIAMLNQQLSQQGNEPVHSSIPVTDERANNMYEEYNEIYEEYIEIDWEKKYYDLLEHVTEMEKFLADYGMIWVGEKKDGQDGIIEKVVKFVPDFDKVIAIIGELNERIASESYVKVVGNEARFQKAEILNLTFYNDGMELENNKFRKYTTKSALAFFRDLEDGYYPTELQESYPDGVIFKVTDKRSISYEGPRKEELVFSGPGYRLGTQEPSIGDSNQAQAYFQFDMDVKKQPLPKSIVKKNSFDENSFRYHYLIESQNAPVSCRLKEEEHYRPTAHPQQCRKYKKQEHREPNKVNFDTVSSVSTEDSTSMNTVYGNSYNNNEYKKQIYDATAELAQSRSRKSKQVVTFDPDKQYEHMIILGKSEKISHRINGRKSSLKGQAQIPNMGPSNNKHLYEEAEPDLKHYSVPKEDEMRRQSTSRNTEYKERSNEIVGDAQKRHSQRLGSAKNSHEEEAEELPTEFKESSMPKAEKQPSEEEVIQKNNTSNKSKSSIQSYSEGEDEENKASSLTPSSGGLKENEAHSKNEPKVAAQLSEENINEPSIVPSNKRNSDGVVETETEETEKEDKSNSPDTDGGPETNDDDVYESKIEDYTLLQVESRYVNTSKTNGPGQSVAFNPNKESEDFVLGNEQSKSPNTSEYRDAFGAKLDYAVHQCSPNIHRAGMPDNKDRSIHSKFLKLFSKGKVYEPKIIPLNRKTSDGQIELNMKSYNGKEIYSAYLYPDDSISKIWSLTELNCEEFVVNVDDKVLHINVPLKNYNINGDVTLNISKRNPSFVMKEVDAYKSNSYGDGEDADCLSNDDYFSDKVDNEEGYSS